MKNLTAKSIQFTTQPRRAATRQHGLSLIELMISITLGLLILASLSTLFISQNRTRTELDKSNRMIDNGRYALELLADNLRIAGFYGDFSPTATFPVPLTALPNPCETDPAIMSLALQLAVQGYNASSSTASITSPPCGLTYTAGANNSLKPGSDILVIRRASTRTPIVQTAALAGTYYLQASLCRFDATPFIISATPANFTLRKKNCTNPPAASPPLADLRNFIVEVYFVSPDNILGDKIPTLKRFELDPTTNDFQITPLVEGIEYMQIEYGLDPTLDGQVDSYVQAPADTAWPNVIAVKLNILARNSEATPGYEDKKTYHLGIAGSFGAFDDEFKRHAYTQFVRLINPAGRRE